MKHYIRYAVNQFNNRSILFKFFIIYLVSIVLPMLTIQSIAQQNSIQLIQSEIQNTLLNTSQQINNSIEDKLKQMDGLSSLLYSFDLFNTILSTNKYAENSIDLLENNREFDKFFTYLMTQSTDIESIYIFTANQHVFYKSSSGQMKLNYDPTDDPWYKEVLHKDGKIAFFNSDVSAAFSHSTKKAFSMARQIKNMKGETLAVFLINLNMNSIYTIIKNSLNKYNSNIWIIDNNENIVLQDSNYTPDDKFKEDLSKRFQHNNKISTSTIQGEKVLITFANSTFTGWKIVSSTPQKSLDQRTKGMRKFNTSIIMVSLFVYSSLIYLLYITIYKPIAKLNLVMKKVEQGNLNIRAAEGSKDEIGRLNFNFNSMISRINEQIDKEYKLIILKKDAEFRALQSQVNHHFLFNTLQSISSIAVVKKVPEINEVAQSLGYMLRYSIHSKSIIVPFEQELEHVKSYITIQKIRMGDRVSIEILIDDEVSAYGIMKLLLQPIVENAFQHGIINRKGPGIITLSAKVVGGHIVVIVHDNGVGMDESTLDMLKRSLDLEEQPFSKIGESGIGMRNVNLRMKLFYNDNYSMRIESQWNQGTDVIIRVPAIPWSN